MRALVVSAWSSARSALPFFWCVLADLVGLFVFTAGVGSLESGGSRPLAALHSGYLLRLRVCCLFDHFFWEARALRMQILSNDKAYFVVFLVTRVSELVGFFRDADFCSDNTKFARYANPYRSLSLSPSLCVCVFIYLFGGFFSNAYELFDAYQD